MNFTVSVSWLIRFLPDNLNEELKELDYSKQVSIAKKMGFLSQKERTDMIRNILHRRIFVQDSQKNHKPFQREKGESTSSKKGFKAKWSQRRK